MLKNTVSTVHIIAPHGFFVAKFFHQEHLPLCKAGTIGKLRYVYSLF